MDFLMINFCAIHLQALQYSRPPVAIVVLVAHMASVTHMALVTPHGRHGRHGPHGSHRPSDSHGSRCTSIGKCAFRTANGLCTICSGIASSSASGFASVFASVFAPGAASCVASGINVKRLIKSCRWFSLQRQIGELHEDYSLVKPQLKHRLAKPHLNHLFLCANRFCLLIPHSIWSKKNYLDFTWIGLNILPLEIHSK